MQRITNLEIQAKSAKDLVALMDAMMVPTNKESDEMGVVPHRSFKIKANFGTLRIGFVEPTIWKTWRKSGRINADAERFMVSRPVPCRKLISTLRLRQWGPVHLIVEQLVMCQGRRADGAIVAKVRYGCAEYDRDGCRHCLPCGATKPIEPYY